VVDLRLYGGRILKTKTQRQITQSQELRDAVVIDVSPDDKYCRVKIQGSSTHIKAWYPENWESTPFYLKPGNAVRITHPGGNKGRIEVAGCGILLPTTTANQPIVPTPDVLVDQVIDGCTLTATVPASMNAFILTGSYRINEVIYYQSGILMDREDIVMDRFDLLMDEGAESIAFDAASSTTYRYDSVVVGEDGLIHVVKGSTFLASGTIPDPPVAPTDHLRLGFVLLHPNATAITSGMINKYFSAPQAASLYLAVSDSELTWAELTSTLSIAIKDQYGNYYQNTSGWQFTVSWTKGNGTLGYSGIPTVTSPTSLVFYYTGAATASVTYTRNKTIDDISPMLTVSVANASVGSVMTYIQLLNSAGEKML
jgi:hypothetical protein